MPGAELEALVRMATVSRSKKKSKTSASMKPQLRAIPGGRNGAPKSAVSELLSGRVSRAKAAKKRRKREVPPQDLPRELAPLSNVFAAGRTIDREMRYKIDYAKSRIEDFCLNDWIKRFAAGGRKPPNIDYTADHSKFKFVMTTRTTLNHEKVEELRHLGIPIDEHTVLSDIQINYDAIKQHRLENKLRDALEAMNVSEGVLDEIFIPKVELKDTFYDVLVEVVRRSLAPGEALEEKMLQVIQVLNPADQMRNVEVMNLSVQQCFDLLQKTEVETEPGEEVA